MSAQSRGISRRRLMKAGAAAMGAAALAACQAATPQVVEKVVEVEKEVTKIVEQTVEVPAAAKPVEIRVAFYVMGDSWMANAEEAIADFESKNPNVKVNIEWRPGAEYWTKLQTEFAGGVAPDVSVNQMDWVIPGAARGMWLDLKPFIERDGFDMSQYFYPMDLEWEWQGGLYGGLLYAGGQTLMINKDILGEAGLEMPTADWTWDDLLAYAKAMTDPEKGQYGLFGATSAPPYWSCSFIHGNGGTVLNDAYNKCTLTEDPAVEAVNWLYERMFTDQVMPTPASLTGQESPWLTGKIGMAFQGTWAESQTRDANLFDWDFAPMPKHPVTGKKSVQLGSNTWSILANTRNREEAWQFVKFMMGVEGQTWMMRFGIPGITSVVESQAFKDLHAPQNIQVVVDDFACCGHDYYPTADCGEWWTACGQEWSAIWSGELTVEEALTNACVAMDEVFARRPPIYEK
ncbi:MAG: sugar ABC transporter substrate-binding protein [Anaerolineae bacterium]|nr:sugar ABC transporter substrate-binding protein [Anaerolineae bacterium]